MSVIREKLVVAMSFRKFLACLSPCVLVSPPTAFLMNAGVFHRDFDPEFECQTTLDY